MVAGVDFGDAEFAQDVRDGVARIEALMSEELGKADVLMAEAVQHLFQAGGKRFRPLFTVLSAQLGPEPDAWQVTVAGAVIELVHLATLYHDDVMDEAQVRRGAPSANARWSNNIAILAGDYLFATASRLVSRLGPDAVRIIADTFALLVTGQMRETRGAADHVDEVDHYLKVVYEKTACLIAASEGEGFGLPLIEAAQHGVPIIARDIPIFREVAGEGAYFFSGLAPLELGRAVVSWLALYKEGRHPKSSSIEWASWETSAQCLLQQIGWKCPARDSHSSVGAESVAN